jgi:hypothetical protein
MDASNIEPSGDDNPDSVFEAHVKMSLLVIKPHQECGIRELFQSLT